MSKSRLGGVAAFAALIAVRTAVAAAVGPADLTERYKEAFSKIGAESPAASNLEYPSSPPFGEAWDAMARTAYEKNAPMLEVMRQIRLEGESGRAQTFTSIEIPMLNQARELANLTGDAALWAHLQGRDGEALELVKDGRWLARSLRRVAPRSLVSVLVGDGIEALLTERLNVIASNIKFEGDAAEGDAMATVKIDDVRALIADLLDQTPADAQMKQLSDLPPEPSASRLKETLNRVNADRTFAAMSLACHLFRQAQGEWPADIKALLESGCLPKDMVDPWGDGKEKFGYALVKHALPDGGDRPLVYDRCGAEDGLQFKVARPEYGFYQGDGSKLPANRQKRGGQFRDVAFWVASEQPAFGAPLRTLEQANAGDAATPAEPSDPSR